MFQNTNKKDSFNKKSFYESTRQKHSINIKKVPELNISSNDIITTITINENASKSTQDKKLLFTNFVSQNGHSEEKAFLCDLNNHISSIPSKNFDKIYENDRFNDCLSLNSIVIANNEEIHFYKLKISNSLNQTTPIRLIIMYTYEKLLNEYLPKFELVFIDLFHLVIPSDHQNISKDIVVQNVFRSNQNNDVCMSNFINRPIIY